MPFSINSLQVNRYSRRAEVFAVPHHDKPLDIFARMPTEINSRILKFLSVADLFSVCFVNRYFYYLCIEIFSQEPKYADTFHLRLSISQDSRWRYSVDMILDQVSPTRFTFAPVHTAESNHFRMYNSILLRRPSLYKVVLVIPHSHQDQAKLDNILTRPVTVDVKQMGHHHKMLDRRAQFTYTVYDTPYDKARARSSERWILPLGFECSPWWFCQRKNGPARLF